jgi:F-type H+-transporting ATPase subunit alpha
LDASTQFTLNRGARLTELLKQNQYKPLPVEDQVVIIYAGVNGFLDKLPVNKVGEFESAIIPYVKQNYPELLESIKKESKISDDLNKRLKEEIMPSFVKQFTS